MTASLRLALFDCDGTLVDSQHSIVAAMREAWRAHGLPDPDPVAVRRVVGLPVADAMAVLLPGMAAADHEAIGARYRQAFFDLRRSGTLNEPLYPNAVAALDALEAEGILLGIATGKSRRGLIATLESHGILARFVTVQTADDGPGKPNPHMVHQARAETGADRGGTVMIGDTVFDIQMARAAGIASIGVSWGYHDPVELADAGATRVVDAFPDVPGAAISLLAG